MPTYVYACDKCGNQFEHFQSFKDEPLQVCVCGSEGTVRRVFQPVGIVFKGSGWYVTDSRNTTNSSVSNNGSKDKKGEKADKADKTDSTDKADNAGTTEPATSDTSASSGSASDT